MTADWLGAVLDAKAATAPLGPVQQLILGALAEHGGLTAARLTEHLGCTRGSVDQSLRTLRDRGLVRVAERQRRAGKAAAVYVVTTTGRTALDAAKGAAA
jgi:DNA-binding MarR family transcriptional regulator